MATEVTDFSHVNVVRRELGDQLIDGVLGSDFLVARSAQLDYGALTLYLQEAKAGRLKGTA